MHFGTVNILQDDWLLAAVKKILVFTCLLRVCCKLFCEISIRNVCFIFMQVRIASSLVLMQSLYESSPGEGGVLCSMTTLPLTTGITGKEGSTSGARLRNCESSSVLCFNVLES